AGDPRRHARRRHLPRRVHAALHALRLPRLRRRPPRRRQAASRVRRSLGRRLLPAGHGAREAAQAVLRGRLTGASNRTHRSATMADSDPLTLVTVLREEYAALRPEGFRRGDAETSEARSEIGVPDEVLKLPDAERPLAELFQLAHHPPDKKPLSALCLSGGGIRSATFNLGVLQGLAARGVLPH